MDKNDIQLFFHCADCLEELPTGVSPKEYQRIQAGFTSTGAIQVWCNRHKKEIGTFDPAEIDAEHMH